VALPWAFVFNEIESADEPMVLPDGLEGEPRSEGISSMKLAK
jgi:hypothetical protein